MREQIEATMNSAPTQRAVAELEATLQACSLTSQQQLAAIALLAARQISVLPSASHGGAGSMIGDMVDIAMDL